MWYTDQDFEQSVKHGPMGGETKAHQELKRAALFWAQTQGYRIAAPEIRVPNSGFRADVAAFRPEGSLGMTAVFECKQSRADFLSDAHPEKASLSKLETLEERRRKLEPQIGAHYPSLRNGDSLFAEYDGFAIEGVGHEGYRKLMKEIEILKNRVFDKTKFDKLVRYGCAHLYYLVTEPGVLEAHELPAGWGWLRAECDENVEEDAVVKLHLEAAPRRHEISPEHVLALLQRLAMAGMKRINREEKIDPSEIRRARRREL